MDKRRKWISVLLEEALRLGVLRPADILRHMTPAVLATDLPPALVASILQAGLDNSAFEPEIVVTTLGPDNLAEHLPLPLLWSCLHEAAGVIINESPTHSSQSGKTDGTGEVEVIGPGEVRPEDVPVIEVLEE